ncbi:MAG: rhodanese-like domain-containing protein [Acetobacteraceae bacterium]
MRFDGRWKIVAVAMLLLGAAAPAPAPVPAGYRLDHFHAPVPDRLPGGGVVTLRALRALVARRAAVLIDVAEAPRKPAELPAGTLWLPPPHRDIPGSLWLPDAGLGKVSPGFVTWFHAELAAATQNDKARTLVFYCHPDCWMSWNAARRAVRAGYTHVLWDPGGVDAWAAAGLPLAVAAPHPPPSP